MFGKKKTKQVDRTVEFKRTQERVRIEQKLKVLATHRDFLEAVNARDEAEAIWADFHKSWREGVFSDMPDSDLYEMVGRAWLAVARAHENFEHHRRLQLDAESASVHSEAAELIECSITKGLNIEHQIWTVR